MLAGPTETLADKIVLLVLDKVLIGALIGVGAFIAARALERFKSSLALRSEVSKVRVEHLGKLWEALSTLHTRLAELIVRRARIITEEWSALDDAARAELGLTNRLAPAAEMRIVRDVKGDLEAVLRDVREAWLLLEANRFWLGPRLHASHEKHLTHVSELSKSLSEGLLSGRPEDALHRAGQGLLAQLSRLDVDEMLRVL